MSGIFGYNQVFDYLYNTLSNENKTAANLLYGALKDFEYENGRK